MLDRDATFAHPLPAGRHAWVYMVAGAATICLDGETARLEAGTALAVASGPNANITIEGTDAHFVLLAANPIKESDAEREREVKLRAHFADFWGSTQGEMRVTYDSFISASPLAEGVTLEPVDDAGVRGWWVNPTGARPNSAILYIHGGG